MMRARPMTAPTTMPIIQAFGISPLGTLDEDAATSVEEAICDAIPDDVGKFKEEMVAAEDKLLPAVPDPPVSGVVTGAVR